MAAEIEEWIDACCFLKRKFVFDFFINSKASIRYLQPFGGTFFLLFQELLNTDRDCTFIAHPKHSLL